MSLPPKFSVYSKLDSKEFENQLERMNAKLRYSVGRDGEGTEYPVTASRLDAQEPVLNKSGEPTNPASKQSYPEVLEAEAETPFNSDRK